MNDIGEVEDESLFQPIRTLAEELNENKILVISTPMWNLTVPYVLKQYIDMVVQPGSNHYLLFLARTLNTALKFFLHN